MRILTKFLLLTIVFSVVGIFFVRTALGAFVYTFQPQQTIKVTMYHLDIDGGIVPSQDKCGPQDPAYGCTINASLGTYPFGDTNPVTVQIEGTAANNRYLRDVIAREMSPSLFESAALRAQTIAARTYAYWHIKAGGEIDNSTGFQVFVPRAYDSFAAQHRLKIDVAMVGRYYMSTETSDLPIFSEFFSDAYLQTLSHPNLNIYPYMKSVPDPISFHPDISPSGHGHGLSQNGAGRWARGSSSYKCDPAPAPCSPTPSQPHTAWPIFWTTEQILTHYYTDIHMRDANNANALQTPQHRWVPLWISRSGDSANPMSLCSGGPNAFSVWIQNSGILAWTPQNTFDLSVKSGPPWTSAASASSPQGLASVVVEGGTITETIVLYPPAGAAAGPYTVSLDMYSFSPNTPDIRQWFSDREPSPRTWPTLDLQVKIVGPCHFSYLPTIQGSGVTQ